jgi:hypothetical protein
MLVELETLKANPLRDFTIDPIDPEVVAALKSSIKEHGFWGGIVCRQCDDGTIEIGAGHHRVQAALEAGLTTADLFVRNDVEDGEMVLLYATENATQRGNTSTALAGTVASAARHIAKMVLTGTSQEFLGGRSLDTVRGQIQTERGLGEDVIMEFLNGSPKERKEGTRDKIPGVNLGTIRQQLANLKSSGDYARIIAEVEQEIAAEEAQAMAVAEAAEREAEQRRQEQEEAEREHQRRIQAQADAEARRRDAEAERKAAAERVKAARQDADRARRETEAQAAEAEQRRREAEAQTAEAARIRAEAAAQLAEQRRQEAAAKEQKFAALRTKSQQSRATAKKAVDSSAKRKKTFDYEGVAKHFKNAHQVDVFREMVESPGVKPLLPVESQGELASRLVRMAQERGEECTGRFIRENIRDALTMAKTAARQATKEEQAQLLRDSLRYREEQYQIDMIRALGGLAEAGRKLERLYTEDWPKGLEKQLRPSLREGLTSGTLAIQRALALL